MHFIFIFFYIYLKKLNLSSGPEIEYFLSGDEVKMLLIDSSFDF